MTQRTGSYPLTVIDNEIDTDLQQRVWKFLMAQEYCVNHYDQNHSNWYPGENRWHLPRDRPAALRCPFAWNEDSLEHRAPVISELWTSINYLLDNRFAINGIPESMNYMTGISPLSGITRANGQPGTPNSAWRVYGDGIEKEYRARSKAVHRDNPYLDNDTYYTLVYFANPEWHPQLYGETLFHSNDATTGDYTGKYEQDQPRHFPIGDVENVVAPRPGRIMMWDSRYLHQIKPAALYAPENLLAISFRLQRIDK
jgi:hypothetical protein